MRKRPLLLAGVASALAIITSIGWSGRSIAQTAPSGNQVASDVPSVKCNTTPDTTPSGSTTPTPITKDLLKSGLPCAETVNPRGLFPDNALANVQRGFDFYSWLTFIALNSPADGKTIGEAGPDAPTIWEDVKNYRQLADIMLPDAATPEWGTRPIPPVCRGKERPN